MLAARRSKETTATPPANPAEEAPRQKIDINALFVQHRHHVIRFVRRYVRSDEDAEDVVQSTFMEAVRCADQFAGLSKPSTWLFGIALNVARNHVRRSCDDLCDLVDDEFIEQIVDVDSDPATVIELCELAAGINRLLADLSPDIRNTFEAVLDDEITYEQAAARLDIPVGTVRSRVSRVRAAVRSQFGSFTEGVERKRQPKST